MSAAKLISELPIFWPEHQTEGPDVAIRKVQICSAEADQKVGPFLRRLPRFFNIFSCVCSQSCE